MATLNKIIPLLHSVPIVLIGTTIKDRINYTTIGDVAIAGLNPPLIMMSMHKNHFSTEGLLEHGTFSVNTPDSKMLEQIDFCGMKSGRDVNKSSMISTAIGSNDIPYADLSVFSLLCKVVEKVSVETRVIFVARVLETIVRDDLIASGNIDFDRIKTISYGLNNKYYGVGDVIGTGYSEGKRLEMK